MENVSTLFRLNSIFSLNTTGYWLSFINTTYFIRSLFNVEEPLRMQPALIYAGLALATLMRSSGLERCGCGGGRSRALWLRDAAQANSEQSLDRFAVGRSCVGKIFRCPRSRSKADLTTR